MPSQRSRNQCNAAIILLALLHTGCERDNTFKAPPPPAVTVENPALEEVTTHMEFPGRLEAASRAEIRARVNGFLRSVEFEPGMVVEEGALLFTIEPEPFEADLAVAVAAKAQANAALKLAGERVRRIEAAESRDAATEFEVLEARAERDEKAAQVQAAEANIQTAQINLGYTKVFAPFAGRLSENLVDIGNLVSGTEATLLTTIIADDPIHAYFNIDERKLLNFLKTRPAPQDLSDNDTPAAFLQLLDDTQYEQQGRIDFANNEVDADTGVIRARAVFPNADERLYPGIFVRVRIPRESQQQILVPEIAIQRDQIGPYLLAVNDQNTVVRKDVELGVSADSKRRIILAGIEPTDRVIVVGLQRARPGAPVNPQTAQAAPAPQTGSEG